MKACLFGAISLLSLASSGCSALVGIEDPTGDLPTTSAAGSGGVAGQNAGGAGSPGGSAGSAGQGNAGNAGNAGHAGNAGNAGSAGLAGSAGHAGMSGAAGGAGAGAGGIAGQSGAGQNQGGAGTAGVGGDAGAGGEAGQGGSAGQGGAGGDAGQGGAGGEAGQGGAGSAGMAGSAGASGQAGNGGQGGAPVCLSGNDPKVIYVSGKGDDANPGNDPANPKKTITSAVDAVKTQKLQDITVKVCRGTYAESNLMLDVPVSLRGGYDCCTWTRTGTFGYPTFDGVAETIIASSGAQDAPTLTISGLLLNSTVVVDGLTLQGPEAADLPGGGGAVGLRVTDKASPLVQDCQIDGGQTVATTGPGSIGVLVDTLARPEITHTSLTGGSGFASGTEQTGSIGLWVQQSAGVASIHDNTIDGGNGNGPHGSVGFLSQATTPATTPIANNEINGGKGQASNGTGSIGLHLLYSGGDPHLSAVVTGNTIDGGAGLGSDGPIGVRQQNADSSYLDGNLIYAGTAPLPGGGPLAGIKIVFSSMLAYNNLILGG
jgi:hypothetical protein